MHTGRCRIVPILAGAIALTLAAAPLAATSFVMVADRDLADQATLIITGRVVDTLPAVEAGGAPATDYTVVVEQTIQGTAGAATLTVRSPGGVLADGLGFAVVGAPRFAEGERVLLFLAPDRGGFHRVLHLMLGAFRERTIDGRSVWVREMAGATEVSPRGRDAVSVADGTRDRDAFLRWLADRAAGSARPADYLLPSGEGGARSPVGAGGPIPLPAGFTLFEFDGLNLRWFVFDAGGVVRWRVHQDGQPGLSLEQTITAFGEAVAAWRAGTPTIIRYVLNVPVTTTATGGLVTFDGINAIIFEDPNDEIASDFSCATGGVLAIGGPWFQNTPQTWNGQEYRPIVGADVITNVGIECFLLAGAPLVRAEEIYGHELGHTLGIGHSCGDSSSPPCIGNPELDEALMRAGIHGDLRGARIAADDRGACNALYESQCGLLFQDGFESGDLSAWSWAVP